MYDYTLENNEKKPWQNRMVEVSEPIYTYIFLVEAILKIIAMGFATGPNFYMKDMWNWLDLLVVITSLLSTLPQIQNVSGIRTFRLFRPLRSLSALPSMRILVGTLLASVS